LGLSERGNITAKYLLFVDFRVVSPDTSQCQPKLAKTQIKTKEIENEALMSSSF